MAPRKIKLFLVTVNAIKAGSPYSETRRERALGFLGPQSRFWGQSTHNLAGLSPKGDRGPERVKLGRACCFSIQSINSIP